MLIRSSVIECVHRGAPLSFIPRLTDGATCLSSIDGASLIRDIFTLHHGLTLYFLHSLTDGAPCLSSTDGAYVIRDSCSTSYAASQMALMSLRFLLRLTGGVTSLSSIDGVAVASLPSLLDRCYLTEVPHSSHATLSAGREAAGLAPLLAQLALLGG
jgi:hypothetical protein